MYFQRAPFSTFQIEGKKPQGKNIMSVSATQGGQNNIAVNCARCFATFNMGRAKKRRRRVRLKIQINCASGYFAALHRCVYSAVLHRCIFQVFRRNRKCRTLRWWRRCAAACPFHQAAKSCAFCCSFSAKTRLRCHLNSSDVNGRLDVVSEQSPGSATVDRRHKAARCPAVRRRFRLIAFHFN